MLCYVLTNNVAIYIVLGLLLFLCWPATTHGCTTSAKLFVEAKQSNKNVCTFSSIS